MTQRGSGLAGKWGDDRDDEWTPAIDAAHPLRTKRHDLHAQAMEMVGNRFSKAALVDLVNWLLYERATAAAAFESVQAERDTCRANFTHETRERGRLARELEAAQADAERLDWLERMANAPGGILLHDGTECCRLGLGLKALSRTLRNAVDHARGCDDEIDAARSVQGSADR